MKIATRKGSFTDENKKVIEYDQVYGTIVINNMSYEVIVKFDNKLAKDLTLLNIDSAELITEATTYENKEGEKVDYVSAVVVFILNGTEQKIPVKLHKAEIYLVDLYNSLSKKK